MRRKERDKKNKKDMQKNTSIVKGKKPEEREYLIDVPLLINVIILIGFGIIMIFSSSYYISISEGASPYSYVIRPMLWVLVGLVGMIIMVKVKLDSFKKMSKIIYVVSLGLAALLLIPGIGTEINNSVRWISIGGITLMPGEIAKLGIIFFIAWILSKEEDAVNSLKDRILPTIGCVGVIIGIIALGNMATAMILTAIVFVMFFIGGMKKIYLSGLCTIGIIGTLLMLFISSSDYRLSRIESYLNPFDEALDGGYQATQSLIALGAGGMFGQGIGNSIQKTLYLPEAHNDFILAIIGEELGFVGVIGVMLLYVFIIYRCVFITLETENLYQKLLAAGITGMIAIQVFFHVGIVISILPPTGVILPLISYGGNATVVFMLAFGVMLNISCENKKSKGKKMEGID